MILDLTNEEATVLMNFINIAVKAVGMDAAESALHFKRKIEAAAKAERKDNVIDLPAKEA
jgi:hypothetical protein